ncbi:MAG TPA: DUF4145 domain-containing protein [Chitinivibrionales bacterium]|nr:DUF4145 domain-containing protein [Chitinivibrionales bacterium]
MDWKQFIAQIISATAWPLVTGIALLIFKNELAKILGRIARVKYKDVELDFEKFSQQAKELHREVESERLEIRGPIFTSLEEQILDAVDRAPSAAILLAWSALETAMADAVSRLAISPEPPSYRAPTHNIEQLAKFASLSDRDTGLLQGMRRLRNRVAHDKDAMLSTTQDQALSYADTALDMIKRLEQVKAR